MKNLMIVFAAVAMMTSCKNKDQQASVGDDIQTATIDSMKMVAVKQHIIDSMKIVSETEKKTQPAKEVVVVNNQQPAATPQPVAKTRKKWSGAAKGAVIGAGVGAITGAVISKKKGEGALIGGLAGAAVGAGTGAIIDGSKK
ncbi:MAG: glycine zipper family protein [Flavobacterium sp.]|nr:glycine zipper family protein [Flavobacterium sp.]